MSSCVSKKGAVLGQAHSKRIVRLRVPVLTMILAATAIPVAFRPLHQAELQLFSNDAFDIIANVAGFVPVGIVLAPLGPVRALIGASLLSMFAETSQLVMLYRVSSLPDVATNILGAILGVLLVTRYHIKPQFEVTKRIGIIGTTFALLLILGTWKMYGNWPGDRRATTPGNGTQEAHWTFDKSSGRVVLDSSGHGLNGEYHNAPRRMAGPIGSTVKFDGMADYVDFGHPTNLRLTSSMTISAWIRSTSFPPDDAAIVSSLSHDAGFQLDTTIDTGPRTISLKLNNSCAVSMARYGKTPLALNTWYYVTGVYNANGKTIDVYLNGKLDNGVLLGRVTSSQKSSRTNVYVGRRSDSDQYNFAGEIADVRVYSLPLTKAEIAADMHGSANRFVLQRNTGGYRGPRTRAKDRKEECSGTPDPEDDKLPGGAATLGVLAAIACAGLFPSSGPLRCLTASFAAGLLFVPATAFTLPLLMLLLSLAGGASVVFTMRCQDDVVR
jgi:hypothetical protein